MKIKIFSLIILTTLFFQGCILAPAIQGVRDIGITSGDRQAKLETTLKEFKVGLEWASPLKLYALSEPEAKEALQKMVKGLGKSTKITEAKVDDSLLSEDGYEATVLMTVKFYKIPEYTVRERVDEQKWKFSISDGWKLASIKIGDSE